MGNAMSSVTRQMLEGCSCPSGASSEGDPEISELRRLHQMLIVADRQKEAQEVCMVCSNA